MNKTGNFQEVSIFFLWVTSVLSLQTYPATRILLLFLRLFLHKTTAVFFLFLSIFLFVYIWRFIIRSRHVSPSPSTPSTFTTCNVQSCNVLRKFLDLMPINLYICLRQGLQHVKPKLLFQNQPHLFSFSSFRSLPPDLPYHQSLTLVSSKCLLIYLHRHLLLSP